MLKIVKKVFVKDDISVEGDVMMYKFIGSKYD